MNLQYNSKQAAVTALAPTVSQSTGSVQSVGAVSQLGAMIAKSGPLDYFSLFFSPGMGAASEKEYIIGDPSGIVADIVGTSPAAADSGSVLPSLMNKTFAYAPVQIKAINYETSDAQQFSKPFEIVRADIDGRLHRKVIPVAKARRNNQFNPLLLTIEFPNPVILSWNEALLLTVKGDVQVTLDFTPGLTIGR